LAIPEGGIKINEFSYPTWDNQKKLGDELETIEIELLLEGIYRYYGFDFRNYSFPCMQRRIKHRMQAEDLPNISDLQKKVLHDPLTMKRLFGDFSIGVTEMFRDPEFFLSLRNTVIPQLKERSRIRIWQAGCSTGEESYSLAILLREEGVLDKTRIYATDINENYLEKARKGIFPLKNMQSYTRNYLISGGKKAFSEYYTVVGESVYFDSTLNNNMLFAQHNLVTDTSFNEFDLIICRNVLIYFNKSLQKRVHELIYGSLIMSGFLGLGSKEGIAFSPNATCYEPIDPNEKIYRKIK
jgi:chemotaxis protein methyltransferase CheR